MPGPNFIWPHWATLVALICLCSGILFWHRVIWSSVGNKIKPVALDERGCYLGMVLLGLIPLTLFSVVMLAIGWNSTTWPWNTAATIAAVYIASQMTRFPK